MEDKISVLLIEDNYRFANLIKEFLENAKDSPFKVDSFYLLEKGLEFLEKDKVDIILLDLMLPDSEGMDTFNTVKRRASNIPIVIQSALDDEELAINAVNMGAQDYIIKSEVTEYSLVKALKYAIERQKIMDEIKIANMQIKSLSGLLPVCAYCKKIRNAEGKWEPLEEYIEEHSAAGVEEKICPECRAKMHNEALPSIANKS